MKRIMLAAVCLLILSGCATAPRAAYSPPAAKILVTNKSAVSVTIFYAETELEVISSGDTKVVFLPFSRPHCYYNDGYRSWGWLQMETYGGPRYYCQPSLTYTLVGKVLGKSGLKSTTKTFTFSQSQDYPVIEFNQWDFSQ